MRIDTNADMLSVMRRLAKKDAGVAQTAQHSSRKGEFTGSIPVTCSKLQEGYHTF